MSTPEVLALQKELNRRGYRDQNGKPLAEDGVLGAKTTYAAQTMLSANSYTGANNARLSLDGQWGANTQAAYNKYSGSSGSAVTANSGGRVSGSSGTAGSSSASYGSGLSAPQQRTENWQVLLNQLGYQGKNGQALAVDGQWGANTQYAYDAYQRDMNANPTTAAANTYGKPLSSSAGQTALSGNRGTGSAAGQGGSPYVRTYNGLDVLSLGSSHPYLRTNNGQDVLAPTIASSGNRGAVASASYTAPTDSLRERLTAMVMKDPLNAAAFSSPDQINETKAALNALGFTGPSSQPLAENGELDVETIIAYEKMRHSSSVFSDSAILREAEKALNRQGRSIPLEQGMTEQEMEALRKNWLWKNLYAGAINVSHAIPRAYYNIFYGGNYDPAEAKNDVDDYFRTILQEQDILNEQAKLAAALMDDSTKLGGIVKNVAAPFIREVPAMIQDVFIVYATGGLAAAPTVAGRAAATVGTRTVARRGAQQGIKAAAEASIRSAQQKAKSLVTAAANDIRYIAMQPVTVERAVTYFLDEFDQNLIKGSAPDMAAAKAISYAIPAALIDGIGMTAPQAAELPQFFHNVGRWTLGYGKKVARDAAENKAKDMAKEQLKEWTTE